MSQTGDDLTGTPQTTGTFTFTMQVTVGVGNKASKHFSLTILPTPPPPPPPGHHHGRSNRDPALQDQLMDKPGRARLHLVPVVSRGITRAETPVTARLPQRRGWRCPGSNWPGSASW